MFAYFSWYPPGHGNVFHSMDYCGLLDNLIDQGRDICFISNIDNMGATVDLKIAKKMIDSDIDYLMEVTEKTAADTKGGTLIKIYGKPMHLEMPQVPKDHIDEFCSMRTFKLFNTNNIWVNLKAVKRKLPTMSMEIIVNKKTLRTGEKVVQLETSVGGAIRNFDKVCNVRVSRARFLPVKKTQDLLAVMSNLYEVDPEFNVHLRIDRPIPYAPSIKLSDHFNSLQDFLRRFPTVPDLRDLIRLKIDGDVCFGTNVVLKGDVIIVADEGHHLSIPSMSFIDNKFVTGRLQLREN
ncbi:hypothetical protein AB6A40_006943 [Gnathostoma spinigerum]|uniref:UTP--glucose-1-phosphate uridylyltransferase n=1 Tax=Gnathostoma spinigerum TaxID=75299 RepID=A0ABD6EJU2_9BILA